MASIKELESSLPSYYTLSNKNLIIIGHIREETIYFYDELGPQTTVIILTEPECYAVKQMFLELMIDMGVTVIDLKETESFDQNYKLSPNSISIIKSLINQYNYKKIITHPKYSISSDPQNRVLFDLVSNIINYKGTDNHYTYNKINNNGKINNNEKICNIKKGIIELYCKLITPDESLDQKLYNNFISITSEIKGLRKVLSL
jgi:hypothetical protein